MIAWNQALTVAGIGGAFAFAGSLGTRIWFRPPVPGRTTVRESLKTAGIWVIGVAAGFTYGRVPFWWLLPMAVGVVAGSLLPHAIRLPSSDSRS